MFQKHRNSQIAPKWALVGWKFPLARFAHSAGLGGSGENANGKERDVEMIVLGVQFAWHKKHSVVSLYALKPSVNQGGKSFATVSVTLAAIFRLQRNICRPSCNFFFINTRKLFFFVISPLAREVFFDGRKKMPSTTSDFPIIWRVFF